MEQQNKIMNILDSNAGRNWIHFAKEYKGYLFTIQEDNILTIWNIKSSFELDKITQVSLGEKFYSPNYQFKEDKLLLIYRGKIAIIDFSNIGQPVCISQGKEKGRHTCCMAKNRLYEQMYHSENDGYRVAQIPTPENENPLSRLVISIDGMQDKAYQTLLVNNTIYWINQDSISMMDISVPDQPELIAQKKIVDLVIGHPLLLPDNKMVILETYDDQRIGCNLFNISEGKLKRIGSFFKKHCIRGYCLAENILYLAHLDHKKNNNENRYKTYLSKIVFSENPVIDFTKELPFIEVSGKDSSNICWLGVNGDKFAVLLGNGDVLWILL